VPEPKTTKTKRARSDQLLESLEEIKETQREQNRIISSLFYNLQSISAQQQQTPQQNTSSSYNPKPSASSSISLESALERLLVAYNSIDANERPLKLRHVVSSLPEKEYQEMLYEVGSVLSTPLSPIGPLVVSSPSLETNYHHHNHHCNSPSSSFTSNPTSPSEIGNSPDQTPLVEPSLYLKELELWNSALHDILTQEDEI